MSRGLDRQTIFWDDRDRIRFLELLGKAVERYGVRLHAYVLMTNHFHLLLETPSANLAACMQWLKQSYSMWFNVRHGRVGPLFQGRYRSVPVEDAGWVFELSLYIHLNPLRLARFKLGRVERQGSSGDSERPLPRAESTRRLRELRRYPWSSYLAYGGYSMAPEWLTTAVIHERAGGRNPRQAYRKQVMARLTGGETGDILERIRDAVAIGSESFREGVRKRLRDSGREIAGHRAARDRIELQRVLTAVERVTGEPVKKGVRGGLGRDLVLKAAWDSGSWTLKALGEQMGNLDYVTVHHAIHRIGRQLAKKTDLRVMLKEITHEMYI